MAPMCDEKVLSDCSMLCSSPISANTCGKTLTSEPSSAGMCRPARAISVSRPMVFNVTVFPPVFGPVITSVVNSSPSQTSMGTTSRPGAPASPVPTGADRSRGALDELAGWDGASNG